MGSTFTFTMKVFNKGNIPLEIPSIRFENISLGSIDDLLEEQKEEDKNSEDGDGDRAEDEEEDEYNEIYAIT